MAVRKKPHTSKMLFWGLGLIVLLGVAALVFKMYDLWQAPDQQCVSIHTTTTPMPPKPKNAKDFFELGNYFYDKGDCKNAIIDYSFAIGLNSRYAQAYNNRAYTHMRMRNYKAALSDLDKAIAINPNYIQARMNRGDIHNYYFAIDRKAALSDYENVIAAGGVHDTSVCGHKAMAQTNNIVPLALLNFILFIHPSCQ